MTFVSSILTVLRYSDPSNAPLHIFSAERLEGFQSNSFAINYIQFSKQLSHEKENLSGLTNRVLIIITEINDSCDPATLLHGAGEKMEQCFFLKTFLLKI